MERLNRDLFDVSNVLIRKLIGAGLKPRATEDGVETGIPGLAIRLTHGDVEECEDVDAGVGPYFASVEFTAILREEGDGSVDVRDFITGQGESRAEALERCVDDYLGVTFPPLSALFAGDRTPGVTALPLSSYTPALGKAIRWAAYSGAIVITGDPEGQLAERIQTKMPLLLAFDTLTGYLAEPRLHWCKLFGAYRENTGLILGCAIDGARSGPGEAEMYAKFLAQGAPEGPWEFHQFLALRPAGDADPRLAADLMTKSQTVADALPSAAKALPGDRT